MAGERLSASLEDYLEAIFEIVESQQAVRSKDIAARLEVTTASVTGALRGLSERGLINYEPYGVITLTREGRRKGREIARAHTALRKFLVTVLAVEPGRADAAACEMEHAIPKDVMERFSKFLEFITVCPNAGAEWIKGLGFHCKGSNHLSHCTRCATDELEAIRQHRLREDVAGSA